MICSWKREIGLKKILILSNSASGLYEFRRELIRNLMGGFDVYLSLPETVDDRYIKAFDAEGCRIIYTPFERRGMNPVKDYKLLQTYRKLIKELDPYRVLTYTIKPNIYGGMACKSLNVQYITNITGLGTAILNGGMLSIVLLRLYRAATAKAACIFFQNTSNMEYMLSRGIKGTGDVHLLPGSGVNLTAHPYTEYPSEDGGIEILSVMRIMKDKGIEELLEVIDRLGTPLSAMSDGVHFTIAGSYEEETRSLYEPVIDKLVKEGKLTYLGFVDDMNPIYAGSHIIVHPSYHEGLSNVCLEAAATGRPVITTDVPGCRETVVSGTDDEGGCESSGILCQPKSAESLITAIKRMLMLSPSDRENMGRAGRKYVEDNFDRNLVIKAYREYI